MVALPLRFVRRRNDRSSTIRSIPASSLNHVPTRVNTLTSLGSLWSLVNDGEIEVF